VDPSKQSPKNPVDAKTRESLGGLLHFSSTSSTGPKILFMLSIVSLLVLAPVTSSAVVLARNTDWSRDPLYGSRYTYSSSRVRGYYFPVGLQRNVSFIRADNQSLRYEAVNRTRFFNESITNTTVDSSKVVRAKTSTRFSYRSGLRRNVTVGYRSNWRLQSANPGISPSSQASSYSNVGVVYDKPVNNRAFDYDYRGSSQRFRAEQNQNTYQKFLESMRINRRAYTLQKKKGAIASVNNSDNCGYCT